MLRTIFNYVSKYDNESSSDDDIFELTQPPSHTIKQTIKGGEENESKSIQKKTENNDKHSFETLVESVQEPSQHSFETVIEETKEEIEEQPNEETKQEGGKEQSKEEEIIKPKSKSKQVDEPIVTITHKNIIPQAAINVSNQFPYIITEDTKHTLIDVNGLCFI